MRKKEYQSLLLEDLRIRWPGYAVRRLALNRHMPKVERLGVHSHRHSQILVYLHGAGVQHLGGERVPVERGTVLSISPGMEHRFEKIRSARPVCLVLDLEATEPPLWRTTTTLGERDLAALERWLAGLRSRSRRDGGSADASIETAAGILGLLAMLSRVLAGVEEMRPSGPVAVAVDRLLERSDLRDLSPAWVAGQLGRSLDHLNRRLRAESGTTVGGAIQQARLERSRHLLRTTDEPVGEIAAAVGMPDQNYFARWFRSRTGQTPTHWRAAMRGV